MLRLWSSAPGRRHAAAMILFMTTCGAVSPPAPVLGALRPSPKKTTTLIFGSAEYKAAVPRGALLRHILLTHAANLVSGGFVQTTVYACLPLMKESGALTQSQITHMLTAGTACFVVGKLTTAEILDLVGPKAAFVTNVLVGGLLCLTLASGVRGNITFLVWGLYKLVQATSWPAVLQMLQSCSKPEWAD